MAVACVSMSVHSQAGTLNTPVPVNRAHQLQEIQDGYESRPQQDWVIPMNDVNSITRSLIAEQRLYLSSLRYVGFNAWIQLYHCEGDELNTIDVVLFDISRTHISDEIQDPGELLTVREFSTSGVGSNEREMLKLRIDNSRDTQEYEIHYERCEYFVKRRIVHK